MIHRNIINAIGEKLLEKGMCPYDDRCPFSRGENCTAPSSEVKKRLQVIKDHINSIPKSFAVNAAYELEPWPCAEVITVRFVDPDEYTKE